MNNPVLKAKVISTGKEIEVYKLRDGNFCNYEDCKTVYKPNEIIVLK